MRRKQTPERKLAAVILAQQSARHFPNDMIRATGIRPAIMSGLLDDWMHKGWLKDDWDESSGRRYYQLTLRGLIALRAL